MFLNDNKLLFISKFLDNTFNPLPLLIALVILKNFF